MPSEKLLTVLRCPVCHGPLTPQHGPEGAQALSCSSCCESYPVRSDIPDLIPRSIATDPIWSTWQHHLEAFQQRRDSRAESPDTVAARMTISGAPQQVAFARFTGISDGVMLDIGCGPGKFRRLLPDEVHYVGIDPIPLPDLDDVDFVRALAEHLPVDDHSVRHITVLSALDHFNDCAAFLGEVRRVLEPGGRLHIIQQVHEPIWTVRGLAHWAKDKLEDRVTKHDDDVPHHMNEFDHAGLLRLLTDQFTIQSEEFYSVSPFAPRRLFITLIPRDQ